ncbi:hypothetical protein FRC11_013208 [Ceratobasidium sp. 423]|nr:hypothetical protein FRC11_013208 [Ceratobasidium sp. 423]
MVYNSMTQQFSSLIFQVQEHAQAIGDLYAHIGNLIFRKTTRSQLEDSKVIIRLYAELCYSLFAVRIQQRSGLSPRVVLIHEHLVRLCVDPPSAESVPETTNTLANGKATAGSTPMSPRDGSKPPAEKIAELLSQLCDFQLLSLSQICEYMLRVIEGHKAAASTSLADAVAGVRLLNELFPKHSHGPWKNKANFFRGWIDIHSSSNENQANMIGGSTSQPKERYPFNSSGDTNINNRSLISAAPTPQSLLGGNTMTYPGALSNDEDYPPPTPADGLVPPIEAIRSLQIKDYEEETANMSRNNLGRPPQTPVISCATSLADETSNNQGPMGVAESIGNQPTNPIASAIGSTGVIPKNMMNTEGVTRRINSNGGNTPYNIPTAVPNPAPAQANGGRVVAPTQPTRAASASITASTALSTLATVSGPTRPQSGHRRVNLHALFQGQHTPLVMTTPVIPTNRHSINIPAQLWVATPPVPLHDIYQSGARDGATTHAKRTRAQHGQSRGNTTGSSGFQRPTSRAANSGSRSSPKTKVNHWRTGVPPP